MNLQDLTTLIAADRIEAYANEKRLVQKVWHKRNGHDLACLLGSLHEDIDDAAKCPAQVMPRWCAETIVTLFDGIPEASIFDTSKRFAAALRGTASFTDAHWSTVRRRFLHATVTQALASAKAVEGNLDERGRAAWADVQKACGDVLLLLSQESAAWSAESAAYQDLFDTLIATMTEAVNA